MSLFRFLFSAIALLPFIFAQGAGQIRTYNIAVHFVRAVLLFLGITAWTYGLSVSHVSTATVISFAIPIFTLLIGSIFLEEEIIWQRWVVTLIGFIGIITTLQPSSTEFNPKVLIFVFAAVSFATLDIINKKFIVKESMLSMLFYSSIFTAALSAPPAIYYWQTPTLVDLALLFVMGAVTANLILFFILKSFALVDATALAPYRYLELPVSCSLGYFVFGSLPPQSTWVGALIIIPSTMFIVYSENKSQKKQLA